jgi:hypothetical protein
MRFAAIRRIYTGTALPLLSRRQVFSPYSTFREAAFRAEAQDRATDP